MDSTMIVKIVLMVAFFLEVTIFGNFISKLDCFKNKKIMDLAMTFSGTLFLSIAMIDVIPEAISSFDSYFQQHKSRESHTTQHKVNLPLTMIIAMVTMMIIMYIDKIMIGHSHDHQYQISFVAEPKKNEGQNRSFQLKAHGNADQFQNDNADTKKSQQEQLAAETKPSQQINWKPFILQIGMSIHAFFQTLALGLQGSTIAVLSLATAILVHKWAEGLTLGLMYKKQGFKSKTITIMIVVQGLMNVFGLLTGSILMGQGNFVMAFFMSMSAGTFFYISLAEVLQQQAKCMTKLKMIMVVLANCFIAFIVWLEKTEQASNQNVLL